MSDPFDVFLSHNSRDKPAVCELADALESRGLRVWLDERELRPGQPWQQELETIIETAKSAAVLVGADGLGPWEVEEMRACLSEMVERKLPVIPVLLPGAPEEPELPLFLKQRTWVDLRDGIAGAGLDRLVYGITGDPPAGGGAPAPRMPPHNLPFKSLGTWLKGRDETLRQLSEDAGAKASAIVQTEAIHGLGGIGKTRLAVEYAWRYNRRYTAILFARAESPETLGGSLAALAGVLDLAQRRLRQEDEIVEAVLRHLERHTGWLLIFDNVDSEKAAAAVEDLLPRLSEGHVIVTSRLSRWGRGIRKRPLGKIAVEEGESFLLDRTAGERQELDDDRAQARRLAETLDGLPLALEQAAAYIVHHRLSFAGYLAEWEEQKPRILEWYDERVMKYPASLAVTWQQTSGRLGVTARTLLRLSAFLASEAIPVAMFEASEKVLEEACAGLRQETGEDSEPEPLRTALADLDAYSMISFPGETFTVHRMVQEVMRSRIAEERQKEWIGWSLKTVNDHAPAESDDVRTWPVWDVLRPHAARIVDYADRVEIGAPATRLMLRLARLLRAKALYAEAEPYYRRALELREAAFGADHPEVAIALNNLATLLLATNRLEEAEPLMRSALEIDQQAFGEKHPHVARDLNNLAQLLQDTNRLEEAEPLMRSALEIDQQAFGEKHPKVAIRLNNLAQLLLATNRLEEAEPLMRSALEIFEASLGSEHPKTNTTRKNLELLLAARSGQEGEE